MSNQKLKMRCPKCNSLKIIKKGLQKGKLQIIQRYCCKDCKAIFTEKSKDNHLKNKTYPQSAILTSISCYNLGNSQQQASELLAKKHKLKIPQRTISQWVSEFKKILPYSKIREQCKKIESPETIIEEYTFLHNNLPYKFQIHKAKLYFLFHNIKYNNQFTNISKFYEPIKNYLEKIPTKKFPHHIFKEKIRTINKNNAASASEQSTSGEESKTITVNIQSSEAAIAKIRNDQSIKNNNAMPASEQSTGGEESKTMTNNTQSFRNQRFPNRLEIQKISNSSEAEIAKIRNDQSIRNNNATSASEQSTTVSTSGEARSTIMSDIMSSEAEIAKINNINSKNKPEQRASQLKFPILKIIKLKKQNLANKLAKLALNLAKTSKDRHNAIQNFMLINDTTTIATEIPVYLTNDDIKYFQKRGFTLNFNNAITAPINNKPIENNNAASASEQSTGGEAQKTITTNLQSSEAVIAQRKKSKIPIKTPITGHIDILQIRNGLIHILDYKPEADKIQPIEQLTIYALALASRTKLDLRSFKCAWFDENNYYEFFPLHAVYDKSK